MVVQQLPKEKATKDGRRWCFYDRIKVDGRTKAYMSKSYMTRNEVLKAERDFLVGCQTKEINVTSMTFKDLYDEFKKFISYEEDLRWKCVFEILYYCGLRKRELKGLTWKDIYFAKKVLSVNKQITQRNNRVKFKFSNTKKEIVEE